jgi:hypothetical protein
MRFSTSAADGRAIVERFHCQFCGRIVEQRADLPNPRCCGQTMPAIADQTANESDERRHAESNVRRARKAHSRRD